MRSKRKRDELCLCASVVKCALKRSCVYFVWQFLYRCRFRCCHSLTMKRSSFSSSADSGVYGGGSRSASIASVQGTYTISNPPGAGSFFNRPQHQQQLDPNGNVFTNYGFSEEVFEILKRLLSIKHFLWVYKEANTAEENLCYWSKRVLMIDQYGMWYCHAVEKCQKNNVFFIKKTILVLIYYFKVKTIEDWIE